MQFVDLPPLVCSFPAPHHKSVEPCSRDGVALDGFHREHFLHAVRMPPDDLVHSIMGFYPDAFLDRSELPTAPVRHHECLWDEAFVDERCELDGVKYLLHRVAYRKNEAGRQLPELPTRVHKCRAVRQKLLACHGLVESPCGLLDLFFGSTIVRLCGRNGSGHPLEKLSWSLYGLPIVSLPKVPPLQYGLGVCTDLWLEVPASTSAFFFVSRADSAPSWLIRRRRHYPPLASVKRISDCSGFRIRRWHRHLLQAQHATSRYLPA